MATAVVAHRVPVIKPCIPSELKPPLNAQLIDDEAGLERIRDFFSRVSVFGLDVETNVHDDWTQRRIRTIQVGDRYEQYVIDLLPFAQRAGITLMAGLGPAPGSLRGNPHPAFQPILELLRPVLESKKWLKVGHNLQFEYENLKWSLGLRAWNFYDTERAERELWKGLKNYYEKDWWALDDLSRRYLWLELDKTLQTSFDLETPLTLEQIDYAALDTRIALSIKGYQYEKLVQANILLAVQIENDAIPAFGDLHIHGLLIRQYDDPALPAEPSWYGLLEKNAQKHRQHVAKLDEFMLPVVGSKQIPEYDLDAMEAQWKAEKDKEQRKKYRKAFEEARRQVKKAQENWESYEGEAAINYGSTPQMLKVLREKFGLKKLEGTDEDDLIKFADEPVIQAVMDYRETAQVRKNYRKFLDHVNPVTGRIHPNHKQQGTDTGRASCDDPNLYNIKRGSDWRSCFITEPGWRVLTADLNGAELRIMAEASGEPVWIDAFNRGWDVHSVSAELLYGEVWKQAADEACAYYTAHKKCKCKEHKRLRELVKAVNFGIAYGMSYKRLVNEMKKIGIVITNAEAKELLARWKATFKVVWAWLQAQGKYAVTYRESRTLAQRRRQYPKPTTADAREKWLEENKKEGREPSGNEVSKMIGRIVAGIERKGMNTPVQGTNADWMKLAMGCGFDEQGQPYAWHRMEPEFGARFINFIYDELVAEAPEPVANEAFGVMTECMIRAGAQFLKKIPSTTEGNVGICWSK